jgi:hypothetical protein
MFYEFRPELLVILAVPVSFLPQMNSCLMSKSSELSPTPWKHMEQEFHTFLTTAVDKANGQFHTAVWTLWRRERFLAPASNKTPISQLSSQYLSHCEKLNCRQVANTCYECVTTLDCYRSAVLDYNQSWEVIYLSCMIDKCMKSTEIQYTPVLHLG